MKVNASFIFIILLFWALSVKSQDTNKLIAITAGIGYSFPEEDLDIEGSGFYGQVEYVINYNKWLAVRPYAAVMFTNADDNDFFPEASVTANVFMIGSKGRLTFPIPYVAPYFELGFGASFGNLTTRTPLTDVRRSGVTAHIPITLGLAIGKHRQVELALAYFFQTNAEQIDGGVGVGFSIPIR